MDLLQPYAPFLAVFVPSILDKMNALITQDKVIWKMKITMAEQRALLSFLVSGGLGLAIALISAINSGVFSWSDMGKTVAMAYTISQLVYYGYIYQKKKD